MKVPLPDAQNGRTLTDRVTLSLRDAILNGYFDLGEKLDPDLVAKELNVSRMPSEDWNLSGSLRIALITVPMSPPFRGRTSRKSMPSATCWRRRSCARLLL